MLIANFTKKDEEIEIDELWMHDYGQKLQINGLELPDVFEVHFSWKGLDAAKVMIGYTKNGISIVDIPNEGLTQRHTITAYIYLSSPEEGETVNTVVMYVNKRIAPEDFEVPEDIDLFHHTLFAANEYLNRTKEAFENATSQADEAEAWAHGREDHPDQEEDNAKYYSERAKQDAESAASDQKAVSADKQTVLETATLVEKDKQEIGILKINMEADAWKAEMAKKAAETAQMKSEEAQGKAEQAQKDAERSEKSASEYRTAAETAKRAADDAKSKAAGFASDAAEILNDVKTQGEKQVDDINEEGKTQVRNVNYEGAKQIETAKQFTSDVLAKLPSIAVKPTAFAKSIILRDSADWGIQGLKLFGRSVQEGTPTPDNPVEIVNVGDGGKIEVVVAGKNMIGFPYISNSGNLDGITYTINDNGGVKASGTCLNGTNFVFTRDLKLPKGIYTLSGMQDFAGMNLLLYDSQKKKTVATLFENTKSITFTATEEYVVQVYLNQGKGGVAVKGICYPMLSQVDDNYESYRIPQVITFLSPGGLSGIPVSSGGNYTDENGQQWVADEIVLNVDGGKRIQRIKKYEVTGDEEYRAPSSQYVTGNSTDAFFTVNDMKNGIASTRMGIINNLGFVPLIWTKTDGEMGFTFNANQIHMRYPNALLGVLDEAASEEKIAAYKSYIKRQYEVGTPVVVYYILDVPIVTDLTEEEIQQFLSMRTHYPATVISNDADTGMSITYIANMEKSISHVEEMEQNIEQIKDDVDEIVGGIAQEETAAKIAALMETMISLVSAIAENAGNAGSLNGFRLALGPEGSVILSYTDQETGKVDGATFPKDSTANNILTTLKQMNGSLELIAGKDDADES